MASLLDKIRPVALLEPGERLVCASFVIARVGPTVGPSVIAVSDRRLFVAPRSAFLSSGAWTRRRLEEIRLVASPRRSFGVFRSRRFEMLDGTDAEIVFEVDEPKAASALRAALLQATV